MHTNLIQYATCCFSPTYAFILFIYFLYSEQAVKSETPTDETPTEGESLSSDQSKPGATPTVEQPSNQITAVKIESDEAGVVMPTNGDAAGGVGGASGVIMPTNGDGDAATATLSASSASSSGGDSKEEELVGAVGGSQPAAGSGSKGGFKPLQTIGESSVTSSVTLPADEVIYL